MKKATFTLMFLLATSVAMEPLWAQSGRQNPKAGASDSGKATAAENQADTESDDEAGESPAVPEPLGQAQDRPSWYGSATTPANPSTRAASVSGIDNTDDSERDNTDDEEASQVNQGALPHNPGSRSWSQLGTDCIGYGCAVARGVLKSVKRFNPYRGSQQEDKIGQEERKASLFEAVKEGNFAAVELLLQAGANVNAVDRDGRKPLHWAALSGYVAVCERLIEAGANVNAQDRNGLTPLHRAALSGHVEVCERLIQLGADVNAVDRYGLTPLHRAAEYGSRALCELLIEARANVDARDGYDGLTPLHRAALSGYVAVCERLIEAGANVNAQDRNGLTPLHRAALSGHVEVCERLIQLGANVNAVDRYGYTPLHRAVDYMHGEVCELLIRYGADVKALDREGRTPLSLAQQRGGEFFTDFNAAVEARERVGQRTKAALRGTDPVDEDDEVSEERSQPSAGSVHSMFATTQGIDRGPELATTPPVDNNSGASVLSTEDPESSTATMPAMLSEVAASPQPADDGQMPVEMVFGVSATQPATANGDWSDLELDLDGLPD